MLVFPSEPVAGQPTSYASNEQVLALSVPIWQSDKDELTFQSSVRAQIIETEAILPSTGDAFPHNLTDVRFGPTWRHKFNNNWITGLSVQMGSASDQPFAKYDDSEFIGTWFLRIPSREKNAWMFLLNYSNNRDFANHIPLPGFAYAFGENKYYRGLLGIPILAGTVFPKSKINLALMYFPLLNINADIGYEPIKPIRFFIGFKWSNEVYFRNAQSQRSLRLFLVDKRLLGGVRMWASKWAEIRLEGGWSFNRMAFESKAVYKDTDYNRIDLGSGPFASFDLRVRMMGKEDVQEKTKLP